MLPTVSPDTGADARARRPAGAALPRRDRPGRRRPQAAGPATAGGSRWSSRATARPSGPPRCCATPGSARALVDRGSRRRPRRARSSSRRAACEHGFVDEAGRLAVITGADITGGRGASTKDMRKMPSRRRNTIDPLELRAGDFVVHEQHGIGRYVEMVQRTVNGADREYLVIEYAREQARPARRPAVRADRLARPALPLRRRREADPAQDGRLATGRRPRPGPARRSGRSPPQLIQLYAARQHSKGHAFGPDTPVAARARGRLPLHRDARPARRRSTRSRPTWRSRSRWTG